MVSLPNSVQSYWLCITNLFLNYYSYIGYEVVTASDGPAALELARATNPDLVIFDLILTEIGGLSICGILRHASQLPILILTAPNRELDKVEALEERRRRIPHEALCTR